MTRKDLTTFEPIILDLLSNEEMNFRSSGAALDRMEKTRLISNYPPAYRYLDTCVASAEKRANLSKPNCSKCWKCARTMITLDLLQQLHNFSEVYDIDYYQTHKLDLLELVYKKKRSGSFGDNQLWDLLQESSLLKSEATFAKRRYLLRSLIRRVF